MHYRVTADTDIGTVKATNQDSICVFHADSVRGEIVMAIVCDGMGGLAKGELASATVIRAFEKWFHDELKHELYQLDMRVIANKWELLLKELNLKIMEYGKQYRVNLGTTFTGMLIVGSAYFAVHIGDTRLYHIDRDIVQLTEDHTVVAQKIKRGEITPDQAESDLHRNVLTQCVGASNKIVPQVLFGNADQGVYMICSDGFRHKISEKEIRNAFQKDLLSEQDAMHAQAKRMISLVKQREEHDNISVILICAE